MMNACITFYEFEITNEEIILVERSHMSLGQANGGTEECSKLKGP